MGSQIGKIAMLAAEEGICPSESHTQRKEWKFANREELLNFKSENFSLGIGGRQRQAKVQVRQWNTGQRSNLAVQLVTSQSQSPASSRFNLKWRFRLAETKERHTTNRVRKTEERCETGYSVIEDMAAAKSAVVLEHPHKVTIGYFPGSTYKLAVEIVTACCQSAAAAKKNLELAEEAQEVLVVSDSWKAQPQLMCLDKIWKSGEMSDVVLLCGGKIFRCHRVVLAAASEVFLAMFGGNNFTEACGGPIEVEDTDRETLEALIGYIYTGSCPRLKELAPTLLQAADKYLMPKLKHICENAMLGVVDFDNVDRVLELAYLHNADRLKEKAIAVAVANMSRLTKEDRWRELGKKHPALLQEVVDVTCSRK